MMLHFVLTNIPSDYVCPLHSSIGSRILDSTWWRPRISPAQGVYPLLLLSNDEGAQGSVLPLHSSRLWTHSAVFGGHIPLLMASLVTSGRCALPRARAHCACAWRHGIMLLWRDHVILMSFPLPCFLSPTVYIPCSSFHCTSHIFFPLHSYSWFLLHPFTFHSSTHVHYVFRLLTLSFWSLPTTFTNFHLHLLFLIWFATYLLHNWHTLHT